MKTLRSFAYILAIIGLCACNKDKFLDKKPSSDMLLPKSLAEYQALLDNTNIMMFTGGLAELSSDDYVVSDINYQGVSDVVQRNAYIWSKDIYEGVIDIKDWNVIYKQVFYANAVLEGLEKHPEANTTHGRFLKGWALFIRAYAFYDLVRNFCKPYDASSVSSDLGIPLRLRAGIDEVLQRATLQESFDRIFLDLATAEELLPSVRPSLNLNRPSKIALYGLLARIYLDIRNYNRAEFYADQCRNLYNTLIDYKTVSKTSTTPFSTTNDELIYNTSTVASYSQFVGTSINSRGKVLPEVIGLFEPNDLRLAVYFDRASDNTYTRKRGYIGAGTYAFTGLATDEIHLIKAECLARRDQTVLAMEMLNELFVKRWDANATVPARPYVNLVAADSNEALNLILKERRKELIWRCLRWQDLKRLNKEGRNIILNRTVNGQNYQLTPNDPRWVFPIPDDEILLSGIEQNIR